MSPAAFIWGSGRLRLRQGGCGAEALRQVYKQAQDVNTIAKDRPLKSRGTQGGRPGAHQRSVSLCTAEKARVFDGYPWTGPGTRGRGFEWGEVEREKRAAGREHRSWDTVVWVSSSRMWASHEFPWSELFWLLLICIWSAAHSPSFSFFNAPPGRHSRSFLQSASCTILQALLLNQHLPQLRAVGVFPFHTWWFES